ncbi:hypothetical protein DFH05DRAFT_1512396 [Lentinula detonsa]|uniref:BZIP domain-containing protein n=1 Tax=Lentinula detonsa TaxID=2804962 RepID=A0A9W8TTU0_9AGAR|nr:hypothetical protein DFH05DRAFT_1512396 [Lentinula detonsa]
MKYRLFSSLVLILFNPSCTSSKNNMYSDSYHYTSNATHDAHFSNDLQVRRLSMGDANHTFIEDHDSHENHYPGIQIPFSRTLTSMVDSSYHADSSHSWQLPLSPRPTSGAPISHAISSPPHNQLFSLPELSSRASAHVDDFDNPIPVPPLPPNATKEQKRAWTKKRNIRSAKLSRIRRLRYIKKLEEELEKLKQETERWRTRAETLRQLSIIHDISYPPFAI